MRFKEGDKVAITETIFTGIRTGDVGVVVGVNYPHMYPYQVSFKGTTLGIYTLDASEIELFDKTVRV